jgi:hypothetical protein
LAKEFSGMGKIFQCSRVATVLRIFWINVKKVLYYARCS